MDRLFPCLCRLLGGAWLALQPKLLWAAVLTGKVVGVSDGDTLKVLDEKQRVHTIRLMGIDAPEKAQPFGQRAKQSLSELVYQQQVQVEWHKQDRYGRILGLVRTRSGTDMCLEQLKRGMAWHYKQYMHEQSAQDQIAYALAEEATRAGRLGLWQDSAPTPPWQWRRQPGHQHSTGKRSPRLDHTNREWQK